jgi:hypothetical protein
MARHTAMWLHAPGTSRLLIVLASLTGFALAALISFQKNSLLKSPRTAIRAAAVWLGTLLVLAVFPERLILELVA